MAVLASLTKANSRTRIIIAALCLFLILLSSSAHPRVRDGVSEGLHKAFKPQDASKIENAIIMGTVDKDQRRWWEEVDSIASDFTTFVYWMGDNREPGFLIPGTSKGREASAYLSFIVDHYHTLPKYSFFLHSGEGQWHNDVAGHKMENVLPLLRKDALDAEGYVNLRCIHEPGCPGDVHPLDVPEDLVVANDARARFADIYRFLLNRTEAETPQLVAGICCAQFVVTRETIQERPLEDYQRMLHWLADYVDNDYNKGWVLEKLWHVIFGKDDVFCPTEAQCRCDLFGWCGPLGNGQVLQPVQAPLRRA